MIKDKKIVISPLDIGEKGTNLALEFGSSKQQSTKQKRSVLLTKDEQIIISGLNKREKGSNLALEFGISKHQSTK